MAPGAEFSKSQKGNPSVEDNSQTTNKEKSVHNVYKEEPVPVFIYTWLGLRLPPTNS
ncbi:hypothetical protein ACMYSQ_002026 [Aspergillus niger]